MRKISSINWIKYESKEYDNIIVADYPFKSFYTYFDIENFWLLPYPFSDAHNPYAILVSWSGNVYHIYEMNSGYGGIGPNNTACLLMALGISSENALNWMHYSGVEVHFNKDGSLAEKHLGSIFESRNDREGKIILSDVILGVNSSKTLCFINPQLNHYYFLIEAILECNPIKYTSYYGDNAQRYIKFDDFISYDYEYNSRYSYREISRSNFIHIAGVKFNVLILISEKSFFSTLQFLYYLLFKENYYYENKIGSAIIFTKELYTGFWAKLNVIIKMLSKSEEEFIEKEINTRFERKDVFS